MFFKKSASDEKNSNGKIDAADPVKQGEPATAPAAAPQGQVSPDEAKKMAAAAKKMASAFGEIVAVLMRSPADRKRSIGDLEWMIAPAVARGQYLIAEAQSKETGAAGPIGFVVWALVSPEVDARLSDPATAPNLSPSDWGSGQIPWIMAGAGDQRILNGLLQQMTRSVFKDREVKMRVQGPDGKVTAGRVEVTDTPPR